MSRKEKIIIIIMIIGWRIAWTSSKWEESFLLPNRDSWGDYCGGIYTWLMGYPNWVFARVQDTHFTHNAMVAVLHRFLHVLAKIFLRDWSSDENWPFVLLSSFLFFLFLLSLSSKRKTVTMVSGNDYYPPPPTRWKVSQEKGGRGRGGLESYFS